MTDRPRDPPRSDADRPESVGRRLSDFFVLVAILLLGGAAVAVTVASDDLANEIVLYAFAALAVGILVRAITYARRGRRVVKGRSFPGSERLGRWYERTIRRFSSHGPTERFGLRDRTRRLVASAAGQLDHLRPSMLDTYWPRREGLSREEIRGSVGIAIILTSVGGLLFMVSWWLDPAVVVSRRYVQGLLLALSLLVGFYVLLETDIR